MSKRRFIAASFFSLSFAGWVSAAGTQMLAISPTTFDFGWAPDNAKISAEFTLKNTGVDMIPITSVQPTCGCTASEFKPGSLASNEETKVILTFNTRGYAGSVFHKTAKVKTDVAESEYTVELTGHVLDPNAKIVPDNDGIAGFEPDAKEKTKTIHLQNKGDKDVTLSVVQAPASWAKAKLGAEKIKPGQSAPIEISTDGSFDQTRETSITIAADDGTASNRVTIAIRTGQPPLPIRTIQPPAPVPTPKTEQSPSKSKKKK